MLMTSWRSPTLPAVRTQSSGPTYSGGAGSGDFVVCPGRGNRWTHHVTSVEGVLAGCAPRPIELCAGFLRYSYAYAIHGLCEARGLMWKAQIIASHYKKVYGRIYRVWRTFIRHLEKNFEIAKTENKQKKKLQDRGHLLPRCGIKHYLSMLCWCHVHICMYSQFAVLGNACRLVKQHLVKWDYLKRTVVYQVRLGYAAVTNNPQTAVAWRCKGRYSHAKSKVSLEALLMDLDLY